MPLGPGESGPYLVLSQTRGLWSPPGPHLDLVTLILSACHSDLVTLVLTWASLVLVTLFPTEAPLDMMTLEPLWISS